MNKAWKTDYRGFEVVTSSSLGKASFTITRAVDDGDIEVVVLSRECSGIFPANEAHVAARIAALTYIDVEIEAGRQRPH